MSRSSNVNFAESMGWGQLPDAWSVFGQMTTAIEPMTRTAARVNCECVSLVGQRANAYLDIPRTLSCCRSPVDVFHAQAAFWTEAGRQYAEAGNRVMEAWRNAVQASVETAAMKVEPRDYITFPEATSSGRDEAGTHRKSSDNRRAA